LTLAAGDELTIGAAAPDPATDTLIRVTGNATINGSGGSFDNLHITVSAGVYLTINDLNLDYSGATTLLVMNAGARLIAGGSCSLATSGATSATVQTGTPSFFVVPAGAALSLAAANDDTILNGGELNFVVDGTMTVSNSSTGDALIWPNAPTENIVTNKLGTGSVSLSDNDGGLYGAVLYVNAGTFDVSSVSGIALSLGSPSVPSAISVEPGATLKATSGTQSAIQSYDLTINNRGNLTATGGTNRFAINPIGAFSFTMFPGAVTTLTNNHSASAESHPFTMTAGAPAGTLWELTNFNGIASATSNVTPLFASILAGQTATIKLVAPSVTPVCSIGATTYTTLDDALAAITTNTPTTIKLLANITQTTNSVINDRNITFDLNGYDLIFHVNNGIALGLIDSSVDYTGSGSFQAITNWADAPGPAALAVTDSSCKLTYVKSLGIAGSAAVSGNGTVIVDGDVEASGDGVYGVHAFPNAQITVNGNVKATATGTNISHGVYAGPSNAKVAVNGNVTVDNGRGLHAEGMGSGISVTGDITVTGATTEAVGFWADDQATIDIHGDTTVTSNNPGSGGGGATNGAKANIVGDVTATGADMHGLAAGGGGEVTMEGALSAAPSYISIEGANYNAADITAPTTKAGYDTYTDGTSSVWLKAAAGPAVNVAWSSLTANGSNGSVTTTALTLVFDVDPVLSSANFAVSGATLGSVTQSGSTYTLSISTITVGNGGTVSVAITPPAGTTITPASRTVPVWVASAPIALTSAAAAGIDAPVAGATPDTSATVDPSANYTVDSVAWTPAPGGTFAASTPYTVEVTLRAKPGYFFSALTGGATINGNPVSSASLGSGGATVTLRFAFPATGPLGGGVGAVAVPALGEWGLILLAMLLAGMAALTLRRRQAT
jgi:hypothetical protein